MGNAMTTPSEKDLIRRWVRTWQEAAPELERIRREELAAFRPDEHPQIVDAVLDLGFRLGPPRTDTGLVEQQRLFRKVRR
jgi:hypothetical protein